MTGLLDHLPDGVLLVRAGVVVLATPRACEILGVSGRRLEHLSIRALSEEADRVVERVRLGASVCTARDLPWTRFGGVRRITIVGSPGPEEDEVILLLRDEVSSADPRERVAFRRHLEWLDGLAAGMAHEIRNPLGGIRGAAQLLRRSPDPETMDELTALIIRETDRVNGIVEQLMTFTRPRALQRAAVLINRLVHDEVALLSAQQRGRGARHELEIRFALDLDPSLPEIVGDSARLREAIGNLLRNAMEAAAGQVIVTTRLEPEGRLREGGLDRGRALRLSVRDDGPGIDPDKVDGLFAPFASNKAEGSGLGLFVARLAVDDHAGELRVDPGFGVGASFHLTLWERLPDEAGSANLPVRSAAPWGIRS